MTVSVRGLHKSFHDRKHGIVHAVQDVSFECYGGRIFGLLGMNGAGKTTILRVISTILKAQTGTVKVAGFDVNTESNQVRRRIGFLPAESGMYRYFTPREILTYYAKLYDFPKEKIAARVKTLIEMLEMENFADKYAKGLSSGMKQKIALARAIVHDPEVIIFDEPTNSLDVITRVAVHDFILGRKREGKCIILSTHIMSEAEKLCDEIGILHKGTLLSTGTLDMMRADTGQTLLEDVFINYVRKNVDGAG